MIIAGALKTILDNQEINLNINGNSVNEKIKFHYGDQKELLLWVKSMRDAKKYPLVWYVLNEYTENEGVYYVDARIVLMQVTKVDKLNDWRTFNTYKDVLKPLSSKVKTLLLQNPHISILGDLDTRFAEKDEPKYGLSRNNDETSGASQSISQDIVDASILKFRMSIKAQCIIK